VEEKQASKFHKLIKLTNRQPYQYFIIEGLKILSNLNRNYIFYYAQGAILDLVLICLMNKRNVTNNNPPNHGYL
jgi:hypothetical protein